MPGPTIIATSLSPIHGFRKTPQLSIQVEAGHGVVGDCHAGTTTQHLYLKRKKPEKENLTQVHLLHAELLDRHGIAAGYLGENLTTRDLDLHTLPTGSILRIGEAALEVTGYRTACAKVAKARPGLLKQVFFSKRPNAGIMAVVLTSGTIHPGDPIQVTLPPEPHKPLGPV